MTDTSRRRFLAGAGAAGAGALILPQITAADPTPAPTVPTGNPKGLSDFTFMFPKLEPFQPDPDPGVTSAHLSTLAASLLDPNVTQPAPGNRDNVGALGSGLTYFGQFLDHDLTRDLRVQPTAFFTKDNQGRLVAPGETDPVQNFEAFIFDLSSLYAGGPSVSPQLYEADGVHLRIQEPNANGVRDLPRAADGSALIGDPRNDENEIIAQVHVMLLRFHNAVADAMSTGFEDTRAIVLQYYQWIVLHEFLPEVVGQDVTDGFVGGSLPSFYKPRNPNRPDTPVEWATAAYRFGHSMVRKAYEVNNTTGKLQVFNGTDADLHGGRPIPAGRQIDWGNFIAGLKRPENVAHFNFPRFVDTLISSGLFTIPIGGLAGAEPEGSNVLPFRNMIRGFFYLLPSGQDVATAMGVDVISPADALPDDVDSAAVTFFGTGTPLWFYILRESELAGGLKLGPTGGRIVADVFTGIMKTDKNGLLHGNGKKFQPVPPIAPAAGQFGLADLAVFAGVAVRP